MAVRSEGMSSWDRGLETVSKHANVLQLRRALYWHSVVNLIPKHVIFHTSVF